MGFFQTMVLANARAGRATHVPNTGTTDVLGDASAWDAAGAIRVALSLGPSARLPSNHSPEQLSPALRVRVAAGGDVWCFLWGWSSGGGSV